MLKVTKEHLIGYKISLLSCPSTTSWCDKELVELLNKVILQNAAEHVELRTYCTLPIHYEF